MNPYENIYILNMQACCYVCYVFKYLTVKNVACFNPTHFYINLYLWQQKIWH